MVLFVDQKLFEARGFQSFKFFHLSFWMTSSAAEVPWSPLLKIRQTGITYKDTFFNASELCPGFKQLILGSTSFRFA